MPIPVLSPPTLRKIHSEQNVIKKPLPPAVAAKVRRISEPVKATPIPTPLKPAVSPRPGNRHKQEPLPKTVSLQPLSEDAFKNSSSSLDTLSSRSQSSSPHLSPAVTKKEPPTSAPENILLPSKHSLCVEHSHSSPSLLTIGPPKPPKDLEIRELLLLQTQAQPTPNGNVMESVSSKDRSHSDPLVPLTNGVQSPSPPPVPQRSKGTSSNDLDVSSARETNSPSPILNRSNRHASPNASKETKEYNSQPIPRRSKVDAPPPVPPHSGKRASTHSNNLSATNITAMATNSEVIDIQSDKPLEEYPPIESKEAIKPSTKTLDHTPSVLTVQPPAHAKLKKKLSASRRPPPRPPMLSESTSLTEKPVDMDNPSSPRPPVLSESTSLTEKPVDMDNPSSPRPPVLSESIPLTEKPVDMDYPSSSLIPSGPVSRRRAKAVEQVVLNPQPTTNDGYSSPSMSPNSSPKFSISDPPKKSYVRPQRNYEEIDILDWNNSIYSNNKTKEPPLPLEQQQQSLEKPTWTLPNKTVVRPVRRNYEEIDILDGPFESESLSPMPYTSPPPEPVSPIMMVAVTRQTSSSTLKFNSAKKIPALPVEDLRENWVKPPQFSSPQLLRRQAKSFHEKRDRSMMCRRSASDRFVMKTSSTLDPSMARNVSVCVQCVCTMCVYLFTVYVCLYVLAVHMDFFVV